MDCNEKPLVSTVVPIYNVEKYVMKCLHSISRQTYSNLQIILCEDSSSDSSLRICKKYLVKEIRAVMRRSSHQGVSGARNQGLDAAVCDYVPFVGRCPMFSHIGCRRPRFVSVYSRYGAVEKEQQENRLWKIFPITSDALS